MTSWCDHFERVVLCLSHLTTVSISAHKTSPWYGLFEQGHFSPREAVLAGKRPNCCLCEFSRMARLPQDSLIFAGSCFTIRRLRALTVKLLHRDCRSWDSAKAQSKNGLFDSSICISTTHAAFFLFVYFVCAKTTPVFRDRLCTMGDTEM